MSLPIDRQRLSQQLADLQEDLVLEQVRAGLAAGADPLQLIEACNAGMRVVGERYERGEYFVSALIMSGEIFREVVELVQPYLPPRAPGMARGTILLGTVQGDIHDIGKNMTSMLLECHGFQVVDLGVDVPAEVFVERSVALRPDVVGLSGLISASFESMKATVAALRAAARDQHLAWPIVIGGGQIDEQVCAYIGADYWVPDAMSGVRLCQQLTRT
jgi:methanogenic corrinoid protein MtbC1